MAADRRCPRCGQPLPPDVHAGTCPACLLREGLEPGRSAAPPGGSDADEVSFGFEPTHPGRVLEGLARSIGSIPRVLLPETASNDAEVAVIKPSSDEMPSPAERGDRYRLFGEIARGGMGAVLKGRDPDLGRDLAVKVLLESHQDKPELVRRFVEEAQIGGQLQHPGIVPVYELGAFTDRRPYFTMKLVKGRTLASLLAERQAPAQDLPRFLSIFEAICQTVAYAHARGVIHRDLKPSNVMVGSFGEVQVMDWGLAKVLKEGGVADEPPAHGSPEVSVIATVRSGSGGDESQAGSVLGTPAYMAPEQASGEVERVDRRADVFGLGSILCELLTGQPAYTGRSQPELIRKAMRGDTADALTRLAASGAEAELVSLAKDCLSAEPEDRPRDAGMVASRVTAYLSGVQERVQAAERERVVAETRAEEERRRRKVQLGLAATLLAFTTLGGLSTAYYLQQRQARAAALELRIGKIAVLLDDAVAHPEDAARWQVALAAVDQAEAGDPAARGRLLGLRTEIQAGLDAAVRDQMLLDALAEVRAAAIDAGLQRTDAAYSRAFGAAGLGPDEPTPAALAVRLRDRPAAVARELADALADWSRRRRQLMNQPPERWRPLLAAADAADPDPWRSGVRGQIVRGELAGLRRLAGEPATMEVRDAPSLRLLAFGLELAGEDRALGERLLMRAVERQPDDFASHVALADLEWDKKRYRFKRPVEAHLHLLAAASLRPRSAGVRNNLGLALHCKGEQEAAVFQLRESIRLRPDHARTYNNLGLALHDKGDLDGSLAAHREAVRIQPDLGEGYYNIGNALHDKGDLDGAIAAYREAVRLTPNEDQTRSNLGVALQDKGDLDGAIAEYREAIRIEPGAASARSNLGLALQDKGDLDGATAEYREAIRIEPGLASAHYNFGLLLRQQGQFRHALEQLRKAHALGSKQADWRLPTAQLVAEVERMAVLAERLPAVLGGEITPRDNDERLTLAQICYHTKRNAAAARLWGEALITQPKLADDRQAQHRYNAACAAALAGAGQGKDEPPPDEAAKARLRVRAIDWLKAELAAWGKLLESGPPQARQDIVQTLEHWRTDSDLAGVRDPGALAKMPAEEQKAWRALWADFDSVTKKAVDR